MSRWLFTSESVTEGHPDKICDQISDAVLDAILEKDPNARVACETMASTGMVMITGEITTSAYVDFQSIVRDTVRDIGYDRAKYGFDADTCAVISSIKEQSGDIAMGVDRDDVEDEFTGKDAVALADFGEDNLGKVEFKGTTWKAESTSGVKKGQLVTITKKDSFKLLVEPKNK